MQLMTYTARLVAKQAKLPYSKNRLKSDANYNIKYTELKKVAFKATFYGYIKLKLPNMLSRSQFHLEDQPFLPCLG